MKRFPISIKREAMSARPFVLGSTTIRPQARLVQVRLPGASYIRVGPSAIVVDGPDGTQRIPVRDVTRRLQAALSLALVAVMLLPGLIASRRKEKHTNHGHNAH